MSTFFFSHFLEDYVVFDLWRVFRHWDKVCDLFIARKRDRQRFKYDFLKYEDMREEMELVKHL